MGIEKIECSSSNTRAIAKRREDLSQRQREEEISHWGRKAAFHEESICISRIFEKGIRFEWRGKLLYS